MPGSLLELADAASWERVLRLAVDKMVDREGVTAISQVIVGGAG